MHYLNPQLFIIPKGYYYYEAVWVNQHRTCIPVYFNVRSGISVLFR